MSAGFTDRDWEGWASGEADSAAAAETPAKRKPEGSRRGLVRLAVGCVAFGLLAAFAAMLPPALPGEMPVGSLALRAAPVCAACPPSERLERLGARMDGSVLRVNVALGAPPAKVLALELDGASGATVFTRRPDGEWSASSSGSHAGRVYVSERGPLVVLGVSAGEVRGVAVRTPGDRIPASGFVAPQPRPARSANLADVFVVVALLVAAAAGWRLGLAAAVGDALALAAVVVLTAVLWRPLAALLEGAGRSGSASGALAVGLLVAAMGFAGGLMTRPLVPFLTRLHASSSSGASRALAAALGALRALVVVTTLFAVADGLAAFGPLAPALRASALAGPLVDAVRRFFS